MSKVEMRKIEIVALNRDRKENHREITAQKGG